MTIFGKNNELLNAKAAAELRGCSVSAINIAAARGRLPFVLVHNVRFYLPTDVLSFPLRAGNSEVVSLSDAHMLNHPDGPYVNVSSLSKKYNLIPKSIRAVIREAGVARVKYAASYYILAADEAKLFSSLHYTVKANSGMLFNICTAAKRLGLSRQRVSQLLDRIKHSRSKGRILIKLEDLEKFESERQQCYTKQLS